MCIEGVEVDPWQLGDVSETTDRKIVVVVDLKLSDMVRLKIC